MRANSSSTSRSFSVAHNASATTDRGVRATRSEYWLGQQGRLTEPVYKEPDSDYCTPVSWEKAFTLAADALNGLESPDEASFYTSGRASNEAAFLYQLFVRAFGTNNLPDCSNMCHESTGAALSEVIGVGMSTVAYDDFERADLIIVLGQNSGTNHPRMVTALEEAKGKGRRDRRGQSTA